jgi:hypothetical protein
MTANHPAVVDTRSMLRYLSYFAIRYSLEVAKSTEIDSLAVNAILHEVINNLNAEVEHIKLEIINEERKSSRSKYKWKKAYAKLSNLWKSCKEQCDPVTSCTSLIKVLSGSGISEAEMVKGFLSVLCEKKKTRQNIVSAVLESIVGENVEADVELTFFKSI